MKRHPIAPDPPAIVRPAVDVEALMAEARMFGRQSAESAIASGEALIRAKEACPHGQWLPLLDRFGFSHATASRLMRKARNKSKLLKMSNLPDAIYDDGPPEVAAPSGFSSDSATSSYATPGAEPTVYCRPCRTTGVRPGCRACAAERARRQNLFTNGDGTVEATTASVIAPPAPEIGDAWEVPSDETGNQELPTFDPVGEAIPSRAEEAFAAGIPAIKEWVDGLVNHATKLTSLRKQPGGRCIPDIVIQEELKIIADRVWADRPTHTCPHCRGAERSCSVCEGEGWVPKHIYDG